MTNLLLIAILNIERALPVVGWPPFIGYEVTAVLGGLGGYFFLLLTEIMRPIMPMITNVY